MCNYKMQHLIKTVSIKFLTSCVIILQVVWEKNIISMYLDIFHFYNFKLSCIVCTDCRI